MADHLRRSLDSARAAIQTQILPVIPPDQDLAVEQASLIATHLDYIAARYEYARLRAEFYLGHYGDIASQIRGLLADDSLEAADLDEALQLAQLRSSGVTTKLSELEEAVDLLAMVVVEAMRSQDDGPVRRQIDEIVVEAFPELVAEYREWYRPLGWQRDEPRDEGDGEPLPTIAARITAQHA